MKHHPIFGLSASALFALCFLSSLRAQEFTVYPNGLIYDTPTIASLRYLVDSVHLRFRNCGAEARYHAAEQSTGRFVSFKGEEEEIEAIMRAMDGRAGWEDVLRSFAAVEHVAEERDPVVRRRAEDWFHHDHAIFEDPVSGSNIIFPYADSLMATSGMGGRWIYLYHDSHYTGTTVTAFYIEREFAAPPLPSTYAHLLQYADCLIDTTAPLYVKSHASSHTRIEANMERLRRMVEPEPFPDYYDDEEHYADSVTAWRLRREHRIEQILGNRREFVELVVATATMAIEDSTSDILLEELAARFLPPNVTFELMRRRQPVGRCSHDGTPRLHACDLATRAARLGRWDLFLRAHLDVMNDRFERMSDGTYAWGGRQTYIREIEELDINVQDLLFGISLSCSDAGRNHYFGSIGRLGRALAETDDPDMFEKRVLAMMHDPTLDDNNRVRMYWLYVNYLQSLDSEAGARRIAALKETADTYPSYLRRSITKLEIEKRE